MPRFWQVFESLALVGALSLLIVNLLGGIVSGIWLAILGEWRDVGLGVLLILVSPLVLGLVLGVVAGPLWEQSVKYAKRGNKFGFICCNVLSNTYTHIIVVLWCAGILVWFATEATPTNLIPRLIWSYILATWPFGYMAAYDRKNYADGVFTFCVQCAYALIVILLLFTSISLVNAIIVFGSCIALVLIVRLGVSALMWWGLDASALPYLDFGQDEGSPLEEAISSKQQCIRRSTRILAWVWIASGAAFTAFCLVVFPWISDSAEYADAGRLTLQLVDELFLFAWLPAICAAVLLRNSKQGWIACVIYSCWTLAGVAVGVTAWALGLRPDTPISPAVDYLRWLLIAALGLFYYIYISRKPGTLSFGCLLLVGYLAIVFPFGFAFAPEATYFTFLRIALALPSLILLARDRPSCWSMASEGTVSGRG